MARAPEIIHDSDIKGIVQVFTRPNTHLGYFIYSKGEAAVIDPLRDIDPYEVLMEETKSKVKYAFDTHIHSDFLSGNRELMNKYKVPIIYGPGVKAEYSI